MKIRQLASACSVLVVIILANVGAVSAADHSTPEGAIAGYIEGVAEQDFDAVVATTSVEKMSEGFDFVAQVERLKTLTPRTPLPASDPFFTAVNKPGFEAEIASQVKFLVFGLMTTSDILKLKPVPMDAAGASDFTNAVRADRLDTLALVKVGIPSPALLNSERYQLNAVNAAKMYGADTSTERVALISFEGLNFVVGFMLLRYGDEWFIRSQTSPIANIDVTGIPKKVTLDEFETLLQ